MSNTPGVTVIVTSPLGTGTFQNPYNIVSRFVAWDSITAIGCQVNPDQITVLNNFGFTVKIGADIIVQATNTGVQAPTAFAQSSGKYYYEIDITSYAGGNAGIVIAPPNLAYSDLAFSPPDFSGVRASPKGAGVCLGNGQIGSLGTVYSSLGLTGPPPDFDGPVNDIIGVAVDLDDGKVWFKTVAGFDSTFDPDWNGGATGGIGAGSNPSTGVLGIPLPAGPLIPYVVFGGEVFSGRPGPPAVTTFVANFGIVQFVETVPTNFEIWPARQLKP